MYVRSQWCTTVRRACKKRVEYLLAIKLDIKFVAELKMYKTRSFMLSWLFNVYIDRIVRRVMSGTGNIVRIRKTSVDVCERYDNTG